MLPARCSLSCCSSATRSASVKRHIYSASTQGSRFDFCISGQQMFVCSQPSVGQLDPSSSAASSSPGNHPDCSSEDPPPTTDSPSAFHYCRQPSVDIKVVLTCPLVPLVVLPRLPGEAGGAGSVGPAGVPSESSSGRSAVPALSPPAGLPAVQQPALPAPPLQVQRGVQVCAAALFSSTFGTSSRGVCVCACAFVCVNRRRFVFALQVFCEAVMC